MFLFDEADPPVMHPVVLDDLDTVEDVRLAGSLATRHPGPMTKGPKREQQWALGVRLIRVARLHKVRGNEGGHCESVRGAPGRSA